MRSLEGYGNGRIKICLSCAVLSVMGSLRSRLVNIPLSSPLILKQAGSRQPSEIFFGAGNQLILYPPSFPFPFFIPPFPFLSSHKTDIFVYPIF